MPGAIRGSDALHSTLLLPSFQVCVTPTVESVRGASYPKRPVSDRRPVAAPVSVHVAGNPIPQLPQGQLPADP